VMASWWPSTCIFFPPIRWADQLRKLGSRSTSDGRCRRAVVPLDDPRAVAKSGIGVHSLGAIRGLPNHMSILKCGNGTGASRFPASARKGASAAPVLNDKPTDKLTDKAADAAEVPATDRAKNRPIITIT
jgi:hypothetical protein